MRRACHFPSSSLFFALCCEQVPTVWSWCQQSIYLLCLLTLLSDYEGTRGQLWLQFWANVCVDEGVQHSGRRGQDWTEWYWSYVSWTDEEATGSDQGREQSYRGDCVSCQFSSFCFKWNTQYYSRCKEVPATVLTWSLPFVQCILIPKCPGYFLLC